MPARKPAEVVLQRSALFVRRAGDDEKIEKLTLTDSRGENELALSPLGPKDDFKLHAEFNRPTHWYLAWLDTKGVAQIVARAERPESVLDYPPGNQLVGIDPKDPVGVHLLLVLVSDRPPAEIESELQQRLAIAGPPPPALPGNAGLREVTRGPGSVQSTAANLDPGYFRRVEAQLPSTVRWVHQLYLPTQR